MTKLSQGGQIHLRVLWLFGLRQDCLLQNPACSSLSPESMLAFICSSMMLLDTLPGTDSVSKYLCSCHNYLNPFFEYFDKVSKTLQSDGIRSRSHIFLKTGVNRSATTSVSVLRASPGI